MVLCIVCGAFAEIEILFVGVSEGGAPSFEKSFEAMVLDQCAITHTLKQADPMAMERFRIKSDKGAIFPLDKANLEFMVRHGMDSTLLVWATIRSYSIAVERRRIFGSDIVGLASIQVSMYSLRDRYYLYAGEVKALVSTKGPMLFFDRANDARPSASELVRATELLTKKSSERTMRMIMAVIQSRVSATSKPDVVAAEGVERYKEPSLSDVFGVPSIEAQTVGDEEPISPEPSANEQSPAQTPADSANPDVSPASPPPASP